MASVSEVRKPADANDRTSNEAREGSRGRVAEQSAQAAREAGHAAGQTAREVGERSAEAAEQVSGFAAEAIQRTAEQGQEAMFRGIRAMAGMQSPMADTGLEQGRRMIEATARVTDVYRDAAERTAGDIQALMGSFSSLGRGVQQWQYASLDLLQQSLERVARRRQEMQRAGSVVELAEAQRDLYVEAVSGLFTANATLLQLAGQIAQESVRPLQERARTNS